MTVPTSDVDLTTVAAAQAYLGLSGASLVTTADQIQTLVTAISRWAMTYCSRDFRSQTYAETRNGRGGQMMFAANRPITLFAALSIDGVSINPASGPPWNSGYKFDNDAIYVFNPYSFTRNFQNVTFTYTAGWVTPGQNAIAPNPTVTLPQDIQQAVIEAVAERFKRRDNIGVLARGIAGETITYSQADLPKAAAPVFDAYRNVVQTI